MQFRVHYRKTENNNVSMGMHTKDVVTFLFMNYLPNYYKHMCVSAIAVELFSVLRDIYLVFVDLLIWCNTQQCQ